MSLAQEIHDILAKDNIRIFALRCPTDYDRDYVCWIHKSKKVEEWREDIRSFINSNMIFKSSDGDASEMAFNSLYRYLENKGYEEVLDVASDVFEGRIESCESKIVHDPDHDEQEDGFGHFGWEARRFDKKD